MVFLALGHVLVNADSTAEGRYGPWWFKGRVVLGSGTQEVLPLAATRVGVGDERVVRVLFLDQRLLVIGRSEEQTVIDVWTGPAHRCGSRSRSSQAASLQR